MKKLSKFLAAGTIASALLIAPTAGANPNHGEVVPMWDPGNPSHDLNNANIVDPKPVYDNGEVITVHAENLQPNTKYVAGQCQMEANTTFWVFKLPGCVGTNITFVETDANGEVNFEIAVVKKGENVHKGVPFHRGDKELVFYPDNEGGSELKSDAEIVIVEDHGKGFRGTQVADTLETFRVHNN